MGLQYGVGEYIARVTRQEFGAMGEKNTPTFMLTVLILGMVDPENPEGELINTGEPAERWVNVYITDKTVEFALASLRRIGFNKNSLKFLDPTTEGYVDFVGKEIPVYCKHEEYKGKDQERWSISSPRASKPIDQSALLKLDALFGSAARKSPAPARTPALAAQRANAADAGASDIDDVNRRLAEAENAEDDIPF